MNMRFEGPEAAVNRTAVLARACSELVNRRLNIRRRGRPPLLHVILQPDPAVTEVQPVSSYNVEIPSDAAELNAAHEITVELLLRQLPDDHVRDPANCRAGVQWLAAAVAYDVVELNWGRGASRVPDYSPILGNLRGGGLASPASLVAEPVAARWPYLHKLYALHCHLLAAIIDEEVEAVRNRSPFAVYLLNLAKGSPPGASLRSMLLHIDQQHGMRDWFEAHALARCRRYSATLTAARAGERLEAALRLGPADHVEQPVGKLQNVTSLREFALAAGDTSTPLEGKVLRRILEDLFALQLEAPFLLKDAVGEYLTAVQSFSRDRDAEKLRAALAQADDLFWQARQRHRNLQDLLDGFTRELVPVKERFDAYLTITAEAEERLRTLAPELEKYLDRF